MKLKTYLLSSLQREELKKFAEENPSCSLSVNDDKALVFEFPIEELHHVNCALVLADRRRVDWTVCDVSEEMIDFSAHWVYDGPNGLEGLLINLDLQFSEATYLATNQFIPDTEFENILESSGYADDVDRFFSNPSDNLQEWMLDLRPAIICHWLIANLVNIMEEMPDTLEWHEGKRLEFQASLEKKALAA